MENFYGKRQERLNFWRWLPRYEPQATKKFFGAAVLQKCCRGVGEQPTFAKQITELHNEIQQKSERKSEESQLPLKSRGCKYGIRFQGQLRFPRQAGDVPQPCRTIYNRFSQDKPQANKSFLIQQFFKNAGEVWASSPHLRSKLDFAICFLCCNCIF